MALDKLVDSSQLDGALTETANAIRSKTGGSSTLEWDMDDGFSDAVDSIVTLSEGTDDANAAAADIRSGKSAYVKGQKVNGSMPTATPAFDGGTLSGGSTATGTNATLSSTDNGIKIQTAYTAASTAVLYNGAVEGWVSKADNEQALAAQSKASTNGTAYFIQDVTIVKPSSNTRTFTVTAPDANNVNHTYLFTVDSEGHTTIKVDNTLTMQWNTTTESLDFIYT